jgi:hypothetical protein
MMSLVKSATRKRERRISATIKGTFRTVSFVPEAEITSFGQPRITELPNKVINQSHIGLIELSMLILPQPGLSEIGHLIVENLGIAVEIDFTPLRLSDRRINL